MRKKLVHVHCLQFGLSGEYKMCWLAHGKVFGFALGEFGFTLYRFDSGDKRNDGFDLFGAVIELATYLGMPQETALTKFLKGAMADAKMLAHLMTCKRFVQTLPVCLMLQPLNLIYQGIVSCHHQVECLLFHCYYFHILCFIGSTNSGAKLMCVC